MCETVQTENETKIIKIKDPEMSFSPLDGRASLTGGKNCRKECKVWTFSLVYVNSTAALTCPWLFGNDRRDALNLLVFYQFP